MSIPSALKSQAFNLVVQKAIGSQGDSQFSFLTNAVKSAFPNASFIQNTVNSADPNLFNISLGNQLLHSSTTSGSIQSNAQGFMKNLVGALSGQGAAAAGQVNAGVQQAFGQAAVGAQPAYGAVQQTVQTVQQGYGQMAPGYVAPQQAYGQGYVAPQQAYGQMGQGYAAQQIL